MQPYVMTAFDNYSSAADGDPILSVVMFEWRDEVLLGKTDDTNSGVVMAHPCFDLRSQD